jgi:hypothetical protein
MLRGCVQAKMRPSPCASGFVRAMRFEPKLSSWVVPRKIGPLSYMRMNVCWCGEWDFRPHTTGFVRNASGLDSDPVVSVELTSRT